MQNSWSLVLLGLAFVGIGLSAFTVNERELAIKLRLGEVVEANFEPWTLLENSRCTTIFGNSRNES